jgi:hypothetical protein
VDGDAPRRPALSALDLTGVDAKTYLEAKLCDCRFDR